jgi:excisionase family DNA binding protein
MDTSEQVEQKNVETLWLSYPEAQKLTSLGRTTLWTLVSSGEIKAARVGRAVRISRRSLEQYMESRAEAEGRDSVSQGASPGYWGALHSKSWGYTA